MLQCEFLITYEIIDKFLALKFKVLKIVNLSIKISVIYLDKRL